MTNLICLPLLYLPPLPYWAVWNILDEVFIELYEHYPKSTYRNRAILQGANNPVAISIPLMGGRDARRTYSKVTIDYTQPWQKLHWRTIVSSYGSAPFFEHYAATLAPLYTHQYERLIDWNIALLDWTVNALKLKTIIHYTTDYKPRIYYPCDLRNEFKCSNQFSDFVLNHQCYQILPCTYPKLFVDDNTPTHSTSILDLLMIEGPAATQLLSQMIKPI